MNKENRKLFRIFIIGAIIILGIFTLKEYQRKIDQQQEAQKYNQEIEKQKNIYNNEKTEYLSEIENVVDLVVRMYNHQEYDCNNALEDMGLSNVSDIRDYCDNSKEYLRELYATSQLWDSKYVYLYYALEDISAGSVSYLAAIASYNDLDYAPTNLVQGMVNCYKDAEENLNKYNSALN